MNKQLTGIFIALILTLSLVPTRAQSKPARTVRTTQRSLKSQCCSRRWPAWMAARSPSR